MVSPAAPRPPPVAGALYAEVQAVLARYVSEITARSILASAVTGANLTPATLDRAGLRRVLDALERGLGLFVDRREHAGLCRKALEQLARESDAPAGGTSGPATGGGPPPGRASDEATNPGLAATSADEAFAVRAEADIARARTAARNLAAHVGFSQLQQTRFATVASELVRNVVQYAGEGRVELRAAGLALNGVEIEVRDRGPGIADVELVLSGRYRSKHGMGLGLRGVKRIVDEFELESTPQGGTRVRARMGPR